MKEIKFNKYINRGAYHWKTFSVNPFKRNPSGIGRFKNVVILLEGEFADGLSNKKVLDIGCGDGLLTSMIAKRASIVYGIDNSPEAINIAMDLTKGNIKFLLSSVYRLPFKDNEFDGVVSTEVIEHLVDVNIYLREILRVVKPGGSVVITTPIRFTEEPLDDQHVKEYFPGEFKELIQEYFPDSKFFESHPLFWKDLFRVKWFGLPVTRIILSIVSYFWNPFTQFSSSFKRKTLQYSVCRKS